MSATSVTVPGIVRSDGTLELEGKVALPPGKVQVTVEALSLTPADHPFWQLLQGIWAARQQAGLQPRRVEEIEAERRRFREEIDEEIAETGLLQKDGNASPVVAGR